jgi:hypothetical protein
LPKIEDKTKLDVRYMLIAPYVSVHIYWNPSISEVIYELEEPLMKAEEKDALEKIEIGIIFKNKKKWKTKTQPLR